MNWPVKLLAAALIAGMIHGPVNGSIFANSMADNDADRRSSQSKEKVNAGKSNSPGVEMSQIAKP